MKVINLLGGPGSGKSTTAAGLFFLMKSNGLKVELVREWVKDSAYEERKVFDDQIYIFAKQNRRQHILKEKIDWIITDSPLLLSAVYAPKNFYHSFENLCLEAYDDYDNYNFYLTRVKDYSTVGRIQTEEQARAIDDRVKIFLESRDISYTKINGDSSAPAEIYEELEDIGIL